jgi:signal transduction histidine kinase
MTPPLSIVVRDRLYRELLTTQPMRRVLVLINGYWAIMLTKQVGQEQTITSWKLLTATAPGWFWIGLWWSLAAICVAAVISSTRTAMRLSAMFTAVAWAFNGYYLSQNDRVLLPMTGFSYIFAITALWSCIRVGHVATIARVIAGDGHDYAVTDRRRATDVGTIGGAEDHGRSDLDSETKRLVHGEGHRSG